MRARAFQRCQDCAQVQKELYDLQVSVPEVVTVEYRKL